MYLQIDDAAKILSLGSKEVTIIGVLLLIMAGLVYSVVYLFKAWRKSLEDRITSEKEHSDRLMEVNDENKEVHYRYLTMLEIIKSKLFNNGN